MRASPNCFAVVAALVAAVPATAERFELAPASQGAILAGAEACIDATVGPKATARFDGWQRAPAGSFRTDGRAFMRDNVLLAITAGPRGACVVTARAATDFHARGLVDAIGQRFAAKLTSDAPPVLRFATGEVMRVNIGAKRDGPTYVQLALASTKGK